MIELIQIPSSPFCLVQRRILEYSGARFKIINIPPTDRSLVWRLTRERYYEVPIIRDGRAVIFESDGDSQVIAKYLDVKLGLNLFPKQFAGVDSVLWRYVENQLEDIGFKLNDVYYKENVERVLQLPYLRHKERKFGKGCIDQWRAQQKQMVKTLAERLVPFELMLEDRPFLLDERPHFIDFDLWGILANFLYSGHYQMPAAHSRLSEWHGRMSKLKKSSIKL